jgi:RNA polymerase sigma factor (TIGR02999 family)
VAQPESRDVTRLLESWSDGDKAAFGELVPIVYRELRGLAASYIRRERTDHTLQPTALVHEAYLRLVDQTQVHSPTRAQFFAVAANLMRQILVNHAERHRAVKRGRGNKVALEDGAAAVAPRGVDLIALDQALDKLAQLDPRQGRIVELRFFGGLTEEEIVPPRYSVTPPQHRLGVRRSVDTATRRSPRMHSFAMHLEFHQSSDGFKRQRAHSGSQRVSASGTAPRETGQLAAGCRFSVAAEVGTAGLTGSFDLLVSPHIRLGSLDVLPGAFHLALVTFGESLIHTLSLHLR